MFWKDRCASCTVRTKDEFERAFSHWSACWLMPAGGRPDQFVVDYVRVYDVKDAGKQ